MKVTTEENFEPIEIKITIESEEELCDLWHRINECEDYINKNIAKGDVLKHKCNHHSANPLFNLLNKLVIKHNLYQK